MNLAPYPRLLVLEEAALFRVTLTRSLTAAFPHGEITTITSEREFGELFEKFDAAFIGLPPVGHGRVALALRAKNPEIPIILGLSGAWFAEWDLLSKAMPEERLRDERPILKGARDWAELVVWKLKTHFSSDLLVTLNQPAPEILSGSTALLNLLQRASPNPDHLFSLNSRDFEELVAGIWDRLGYEVELTQQTRDGGRDIIAVRKKEMSLRVLIECKRYAPQRKVSVSYVRQLYGVKVSEGASKAILVTTSSFTRDAMDFFEAHPWELEPRALDGVMSWIQMVQSARS